MLAGGVAGRAVVAQGLTDLGGMAGIRAEGEGEHLLHVGQAVEGVVANGGIGVDALALAVRVEHVVHPEQGAADRVDAFGERLVTGLLDRLLDGGRRQGLAETDPRPHRDEDGEDHSPRRWL